MAASTQIDTLRLRNRSIDRHVPHINSTAPNGKEINDYLDNYTLEISNGATGLSFKKRTDYWSSKVAESVHICIDVMLPEFNNFCNIILLRFLLIGYSVHELAKIWKIHKKDIKTHKTIKEWLPYIVKQKLGPNLVTRGKYCQLRKYARLYEKRFIIVEIFKLRKQYTHRLNEMMKWLSEFDTAIREIADQRDIDIPNDAEEQCNLYYIYLAYHKKYGEDDDDDDDDIDNDDGNCPILDNIRMQDDDYDENDGAVNTFHNDDNNDSDDSDNDNDNDENEEKILTKEEKSKLKIKELRNELKKVSQELRQTRINHCQAARERHIYRSEYAKQQIYIEDLHKCINKKNKQLINLENLNNKFKQIAIDSKNYLIKLKNEFIKHSNYNNSNNISQSQSQTISIDNYSYTSFYDNINDDNSSTITISNIPSVPPTISSSSQSSSLSSQLSLLKSIDNDNDTISVQSNNTNISIMYNNNNNNNNNNNYIKRNSWKHKKKKGIRKGNDFKKKKRWRHQNG